jgi:hypothetical protein
MTLGLLWNFIIRRNGMYPATLTIVWGIDGFHVINLMTNDRYSTHCSPNNVMEPLLRVVFADGWKPHSHRPGVYLDNCRVHRSTVPA